MTRTIILTGARGGQGTSTVAVALSVLAARHGPTLLRSDDPTATAALVGIPLPLGDERIAVGPNLAFAADTAGPDATATYETVVIDDGRTPTGPFDDPQPHHSASRDSAGGIVERYAVLRGPCYLALCTLLNIGCRDDGVIVVAEPGRALSECDVADVLGIPVVATVPVNPAIARTIDAGLLLARLHHRATPFGSLSPLAQPRDRLTTTPMQIDTDLHLSMTDRSGAKVACRVRPFQGAVCRACTPLAGRSDRAEHRSTLARRG